MGRKWSRHGVLMLGGMYGGGGWGVCVCGVRGHWRGGPAVLKLLARPAAGGHAGAMDRRQEPLTETVTHPSRG